MYKSYVQVQVHVSYVNVIIELMKWNETKRNVVEWIACDVSACASHARLSDSKIMEKRVKKQTKRKWTVFYQLFQTFCSAHCIVLDDKHHATMLSVFIDLVLWIFTRRIAFTESLKFDGYTHSLFEASTFSLESNWRWNWICNDAQLKWMPIGIAIVMLFTHHLSDSVIWITLYY